MLFQCWFLTHTGAVHTHLESGSWAEMWVKIGAAWCFRGSFSGLFWYSEFCLSGFSFTHTGFEQGFVTCVVTCSHRQNSLFVNLAHCSAASAVSLGMILEVSPVVSLLGWCFNSGGWRPFYIDFQSSVSSIHKYSHPCQAALWQMEHKLILWCPAMGSMLHAPWLAYGQLINKIVNQLVRFFLASSSYSGLFSTSLNIVSRACAVVLTVQPRLWREATVMEHLHL